MMDPLYRCTACNYKFPGLMAEQPDGSSRCPKCKTAIVSFSDGSDSDGDAPELAYEYLAHASSDDTA